MFYIWIKYLKLKYIYIYSLLIKIIFRSCDINNFDCYIKFIIIIHRSYGITVILIFKKIISMNEWRKKVKFILIFLFFLRKNLKNLINVISFQPFFQFCYNTLNFILELMVILSILTHRNITIFSFQGRMHQIYLTKHFTSSKPYFQK